jgi:hypothetical protein
MDPELQLFQLQEKFNAYVSFLLDGELAEAHPELAGKNARIELRCAAMPEGTALDLLNAIHDQLALQEIRVEVIVEGSRRKLRPRLWLRSRKRLSTRVPSAFKVASRISETLPLASARAFRARAKNSNSIRNCASSNSPPTF